jgi:hypothetical protein
MAETTVDQAIQACEKACGALKLGVEEELEVFSTLMRIRLFWLVDCEDKAFEHALEKIISETRAGYDVDKRMFGEEDLVDVLD